jgi:hypothetical protein
LQALIGSLMFLHKAIKPARLFVNRILALLRKMGDANVVAIDEGFHRNRQWFIACTQAVNGSVTIFKCVQPRLDIFVALKVFSSFLSHQRVTVWCDSRMAMSVLQSGRGSDPVLHTVARNIWLLLSSLDCYVVFSHIPGRLNVVADLLSRWDSRRCPTADLFSLLGMVPIRLASGS